LIYLVDSQDRIRFDFDHAAFAPQTCNNNHCRRRTNVAQNLAVRAANRICTGHVGDVDPHTHDVLNTRPRMIQGRLDFAHDEMRLRVSIARCVDRTGFICCNRSGDKYLLANTDCTRVADLGLPNTS